MKIFPAKNGNGGIVPPFLSNPITLPVQPPGWQEPSGIPNWMKRDLGHEATSPTAHPNWYLNIR